MSLVNIISTMSRANGGPGLTPSTDGYIDVIWLMGQSNCGRSRVSDMTTPQADLYAGLIPRSYIYNPYFTPASNPLNVGVNTHLMNPVEFDEFGCEASLFKSFSDYDSNPRLLLKYSYGNTNLNDDWLSQLDEIDAILDNLLIVADDLGYKPRVKSFIWFQGENDATDSSWASLYLSNLTTFHSEVKTMWSDKCIAAGIENSSGYKKVICRIDGEFDPTQVYRATVRTAQANYCAIGGNNAILVDTDAYASDAVHLTPTGQIDLGNDIFNLIKTL